MVYGINSNKLKDKVADPKEHTGVPRKIASATCMLSVPDKGKPRATHEQISMPRKCRRLNIPTIWTENTDETQSILNILISSTHY